MKKHICKVISMLLILSLMFSTLVVAVDVNRPDGQGASRLELSVY